MDGAVTLNHGMQLYGGLQGLVSAYEMDREQNRDSVNKLLSYHFMGPDGRPLIDVNALSDDDRFDMAKKIYKSRLTPQASTIAKGTVSKNWKAWMGQYGVIPTITGAGEIVERLGHDYEVQGTLRTDIKTKRDKAIEYITRINRGDVPDELVTEKTDIILRIATTGMKDEGYFKVDEFRQTITELASKYKNAFAKTYIGFAQKDYFELLAKNDGEFKKYYEDIIDKVAKKTDVDPIEKFTRMYQTTVGLEDKIKKEAKRLKGSGLEEELD